MSQLEELLNRFYIRSNTYKIETYEKWGDLIIQENFWNKILDSSLTPYDLYHFFKEKTNEEKEEYLEFGIACLMYFVQANYTGPRIPHRIEEFLTTGLFKTVDFAIYLSINDEEINVNTKHPVLLVVSKLIFNHCMVHNVISTWWSLRAVMVHQDILDETNYQLFLKVELLIGRMEVFLSNGIKAEFHMELIQVYLKFGCIYYCKKKLDSVKKFFGLEYELPEILSKIIKFQTTDVEREGIHKSEIENIVLPQSFNPNEVLLGHTSLYTESEKIEFNYQQKLLLAMMHYTLNATPAEEIPVQEILPFLKLFLKQRNTYGVKTMALLIQCNLEDKNINRSIERCVKQYGEILNFFNDRNPPSTERIGDVFTTFFPPVWKVKAQFANALLNFGCVKNSLEICLELQLIDEIVVCYTLLNMKEKAEEFIMKQLEIKSTTNQLMCALGDATNDESWYQTAWKLSQRKDVRIQRNWGNFLFNQEKYSECILHFKKSLEFNPFQPQVHFRLGYAALQEKDKEMAIYEYNFYASLKPNGFEAWNSLAQVYLKFGDKEGAHKAIQNGVRNNPQNFKLWQYLLEISRDILHLSDLIRAYNRLIDLDENYLNIEILEFVVYKVCGAELSGRFPAALRCLPKTLELVRRIAMLNPSHGAVWDFYALFTPNRLLKIQRLQRSYRGFTKGRWDTSSKSCAKVLLICSKLGKLVLDDEINAADTIINSVKLNLSAALTTAEKHYWEDDHDVEPLIKEISGQLNLIANKIKNSSSNEK